MDNWNVDLNDSSWPLCRAFHNGHYEKTTIMRSSTVAGARTTWYVGGPRRSNTSHNHSPLRNSSRESEAWKRRLAVSGSCIRANAFSFIARLASVY